MAEEKKSFTQQLDEVLYEAGVNVTFDGGKTWCMRHEGCAYYALGDSVCNKCGKFVPAPQQEGSGT